MDIVGDSLRVLYHSEAFPWKPYSTEKFFNIYYLKKDTFLIKLSWVACGPRIGRGGLIEGWAERWMDKWMGKWIYGTKYSRMDEVKFVEDSL